MGSASALTTDLTAARPVFLDTVATGYQFVTISNSPQVGDWIQVTLIKTNGTYVSLGITNTVPGTSISDMAQSMMNLINSTAALQGADGAMAGDLTYDSTVAQFFLYARTSGWPAAQILASWNTSTNLQATPSDFSPLADNSNDLRPKNHLYVSSGDNFLNVNFACQTTNWPTVATN